MVFGSSGGAVTALALVQTHPEQVHTVIAHEPPIVSLLANRDEVHAGTQDQIETYLGGDVVGAWKKFFAQANLMAPEGMIEMIFGGVREPQVVADELRWFAHELSETTHWEPDFSALRTASTRIVIGIGSDSTDQQCDRTSRALAAALGSEPAMFPGGHTGCAELPEDFAARLREI
jgi:pimeloyl-ACP methyl ester carboxylesterase